MFYALIFAGSQGSCLNTRLQEFIFYILIRASPCEPITSANSEGSGKPVRDLPGPNLGPNIDPFPNPK